MGWGGDTDAAARIDLILILVALRLLLTGGRGHRRFLRGTLFTGWDRRAEKKGEHRR
jgi:hypothetical protein